MNGRWRGIPPSKQVVLITLGSEILHSSDAHHLHHISRSLSSHCVLNSGPPSISKHIGSLISICSTSWSKRIERLCTKRRKSAQEDLSIIPQKCLLRVFWIVPRSPCSHDSSGCISNQKMRTYKGPFHLQHNPYELIIFYSFQDLFLGLKNLRIVSPTTISCSTWNPMKKLRGSKKNILSVWIWNLFWYCIICACTHPELVSKCWSSADGGWRGLNKCRKDLHRDHYAAEFQRENGQHGHPAKLGSNSGELAFSPFIPLPSRLDRLAPWGLL